MHLQLTPINSAPEILFLALGAPAPLSYDYVRLACWTVGQLRLSVALFVCEITFKSSLHYLHTQIEELSRFARSWGQRSRLSLPKFRLLYFRSRSSRLWVGRT